MPTITRRLVMLVALLTTTTSIAVAQAPVVRLTEGPENNPAQFIGTSAVDYPMLQVAIENMDAQDTVEVRGLTFTASGTGNDVSALVANGVSLYHDLNNDGEADMGGDTPDVELAMATAFSIDNGTVSFDFTATPVEIPPDETANFVVIYNMAGTATTGQTFKLDLLNATDLNAVNAADDAPVQIFEGSFPVVGITKSIGQGRLLLNALAPLNAQVPAWLPNYSHNGVIRLKIDNTADERVEITNIQVEVTGTANDPLVVQSGGMGFQVVVDNNALPDAGEASIGSGSISADNGTANIVINPPLEIPRGAVLYTYVLLNSNFNKPEYFKTMQFRLPIGGVTANGLDSGVPNLEIVGENLAGPLWQYRGSRVITALSSRDLGDEFASPGSVNYPALAFNVKAEKPFEAITITDLTFKTSGSLNDVTEIDKVDLWLDSGTREGRVDIEGQPGVVVPDVLLTEGSSLNFNADDGTVTISGLNVTANQATTRLLVTVDISSDAEEGRTFKVEIPTALSVGGQGTITQRDPVIDVISSGMRTIQDNSATLVNDTASAERFERAALPRLGTDLLAWNFNVETGPNEPLYVRQVRMTMNKTWAEAGAIQALRLGLDNGRDGDFGDNNDYLIATIDQSTAGDPLDQTGDVTLSFVASEDIEFDRDTTRRMELWMDLAGSQALWDEELTFSITQIELRGVFSGLPVVVTPLPFSRGAIPIMQPTVEVDYSTAYDDGDTYLTCINNGLAEFTTVRLYPAPSEDIRLESALINGTSGVNPSYLTDYVTSVGSWRTNDGNLNITSSDIILDDDEIARPFSGGQVLVDDLRDQFSVVERTSTQAAWIGFYLELFSPTAVPVDGSVFFMANIAQDGLNGIGLDSGDPIRFVHVGTGDPVAPPAVTLQMTNGNVGGILATLTEKPVAPGTDDNEAWGMQGFFNIVEPYSLNRATFQLAKSRPDLDLTQVFAPDAFELAYNNKLEKVPLSGGVIDYGNETVTFTNVVGPWYLAPISRFKVLADVLPTAPEGDWVELRLLSEADLRFDGACSLTDESQITHAYSFEFPAVGRRMLFQTEGLRLDLAQADDDIPWVAFPDRASQYAVARMRARTISDIETVSIGSLTLDVGGTADLAEVLAPVDGAQLFAGSTLVGTGTYNASESTLTFPNLDVIIATGTTQIEVRLTRRLAEEGVHDPDAFDGQTIQFSFRAEDLDASGAASGIGVANYLLNYDLDPELEESFPFVFPEIRLGAGRLFAEERSNAPDEQFVVSDSVNVVTIPFLVEADRSENADLEEVLVSLTGTLNDLTAIDGPVVRLYQDNSPVGVFNDTGSADTLLGTGEVFTDDGNARIRMNPPFQLPNGAPRNFILVVDLNGTATDFETFQHSLGALGLVARGEKSDDVLTLHYGTDKASEPSLAALTGILTTVGKATIDLDVTNDLPQPDAKDPLFVLPDADGVPMLSIDFDVLEIEDLEVTGLVIDASGNGNDLGAVEADGVIVWDDLDKDGRLDATDVRLGSASFTQDNETLEIPFDQPISLVEDQSGQWLVTYNFGASSQAGTTFAAGIDLLPMTLVARDDIILGTGLFSQRPVGVIRSGGGSSVLSGPIYQISSGILEVRRGTSNPSSRDVLTQQANVPVLHFYVDEALDMEDADLQQIDLTVVPNGVDVGAIFATNGVKLYRDTNNNGQVDGGIDVEIATGVVNAGAQRITFNLGGVTEIVPLGDRVNYLVVASFDAGPEAIGNNFRLSITGPSQVQAIGQTSALANVIRVPSVIDSGTFTFNTSETTVSRGSASPGANDGINPAAQDATLLSLNFRPSSAADVVIDSLTVRGNGSANESTVFNGNSVRLVYDNGTVTNTLDPGDTILASGSFPFDDAPLTFVPAASPVFERNVTARLLIVANLNGTGNEGQSVGARVAASTDIVTSVAGQAIPSTIDGSFPIAGGPTPLVETRLTVLPYDVQPDTFDILPSAINAVLWQGVLRSSVTEDITVDTVTFQAAGTANELTALTGGNVSFARDANGNGVYDGSDSILSTAAFSVDNGTVTFTGVDLDVDADDTENVLVVGTLSGGANLGDTFIYTLTGTTGTGVDTGLGSLTANAPFVGPTVVVAEASFLVAEAGAESANSYAHNDQVDYILQTVRLVTSSADDITLQSLGFELIEPTDTAFMNAGSVELVHDSNRSGVVDAGDAILATGLNFTGGALSIPGLTMSLPAASETFLLLTADLNGTAGPGANIQARIPGGSVAGLADSTSTAASVFGLPRTGASRTLIPSTDRLLAPLLIDFEDVIHPVRPSLQWGILADPNAISGSNYMRVHDSMRLLEDADYSADVFPSINAAASPGVKTISFWTRYSFPDTSYRARLQYSTNGGASWSTTSTLSGSTDGWEPRSFNYGSAQNTSDDFRVRFLMDGGSGESGAASFEVDRIIYQLRPDLEIREFNPQAPFTTTITEGLQNYRVEVQVRNTRIDPIFVNQLGFRFQSEDGENLNGFIPVSFVTGPPGSEVGSGQSGTFVFEWDFSPSLPVDTVLCNTYVVATDTFTGGTVYADAYTRGDFRVSVLRPVSSIVLR